MSEFNELERRIAALEAQVGMEAGLRASGDRDLADVKTSLRATNHLVQALAITQSQHTEALANLQSGVDHIIALLNRLIDEGSQ
jgi:hypothetical protein